MGDGVLFFLARELPLRDECLWALGAGTLSCAWSGGDSHLSWVLACFHAVMFSAALRSAFATSPQSDAGMAAVMASLRDMGGRDGGGAC